MHTDDFLRSPATLARPAALAGLFLLAATACEPVPDDVEGAATEPVQSSLSFKNVPGTSSPFQQDGATRCFLQGTAVHCCPSGMVMTGAHLGNNRFKCALIEGSLSGIHGDGSLGNTYTVRNGMHSCPFGEVMIGYHGGSSPWYFETLLCAKPSTPVIWEKVDGHPPTSDGFMHVCPEKDLNGKAITNPGRFAMTGIHAGSNLFNCGI